MANPPSPKWTLRCPWCDWRIVVSARGAGRGDPGSGVAAANLGAKHAADIHGRTWREFLDALQTSDGEAAALSRPEVTS